MGRLACLVVTRERTVRVRQERGASVRRCRRVLVPTPHLPMLPKLTRGVGRTVLTPLVNRVCLRRRARVTNRSRKSAEAVKRIPGSKLSPTARPVNSLTVRRARISLGGVSRRDPP